jgi:hypothetical protein
MVLPPLAADSLAKMPGSVMRNPSRRETGDGALNPQKLGLAPVMNIALLVAAAYIENLGLFPHLNVDNLTI